jgi:hypothetical protein
MPRTTAVIACAIACLVTGSCFIPSGGSISVVQDEKSPWTFGTGWSFTWMIDQSAVAYERNTRLKLTVHEIQSVLSGSTLVTRKLIGNLSRELDLGGGVLWMPMVSQSLFAELDIVAEVYTLTSSAIGNNVFMLPMALTMPMWHFKSAYGAWCNSTSWNITLDETALVFDARNKTSPDQRISIDFNDKGIVNDFLMTYSNGTTKFHMFLESTYDPDSGMALFINVLTLSSVGAIIAIVIALLFKKYKIKPRDLLRGVKHPQGDEPGDPEQPDAKGDAF